MDHRVMIMDPRGINKKITLKELASRLIPYCAYYNEPLAVCYLVEKFNAKINTIGTEDYHLASRNHTALTWAALDGDCASAKTALDCGAYIDQKDNKYCESPLSWASLNGHPEMVALLLQHSSKKSHQALYWLCNPPLFKKTLTEPHLKSLAMLLLHSIKNKRYTGCTKEYRSKRFPITQHYKKSPEMTKKAEKLLHSKLLTLEMYLENEAVLPFIRKLTLTTEASQAITFASDTNNVKMAENLLKGGALAQHFVKNNFFTYSPEMKKLLQNHAIIESVADKWKPKANIGFFSRIKQNVSHAMKKYCSLPTLKISVVQDYKKLFK